MKNETMTARAGHTAGGWKVREQSNGLFWIERPMPKEGSHVVAQDIVSFEVAERIVRAVNSHAKLLAALKALVEDVSDSDHEPHDWSEQVCLRKARAAIQRAERGAE